VFLLAAAVLLLTAISAHAQPAVPPLTSNRPGIGDSEAIVARGAIQVESGVQWQDAPLGEDRRWTQTWGQLTVRVGLTPRLEVFGGWDGLSVDRVRVNGESRLVTGGNDVRLGAKLGVLTEERNGLTLTVAPAWSFPVGSQEFTTNSNDGSLRLLWARSLPQDWLVSGNLLFTRTTDAGQRYWDNGVMLGLSRQITPAVGAFVELSAVLLASQPDAYTTDAGFAWVTSPDLQWDVSAGHTFANRGDDWFVSAGITLRFRP
jgi:Putative MetA-pathway of phenol degradation